ncbi:MAG TPA: isoleucine--tRNA ligase [Alphaproteobacteria bacterium]|nr:isoleucine--tRNA ligase [Alphaproteobacteria bacterium]
MTADYSKTLQLPQTGFAMRANLPEREPRWIADTIAEGFYQKLRDSRTNADKFIVHLGPPYANGAFHMGHVLTYVLKDFVVRCKFMQGFDSPYVPGWDCHGLPIEWKVEEDLRKGGKSKRDISKAELRQRCREYAQKWIDVQNGDWQRLECLADWDRPYKTMAPQNEAGIVRELGKMVERGLVYRGLRPTLWATVEETAMAEAEIEYDENHKSKAVYVALPLVGKENEFLVIWTTTPWTLPANRAVAVKGDEAYMAIDTGDKTVWIAEKLRADFGTATGLQGSVKNKIRGEQMMGWTYVHPLYDDVTGKVVLGDHVTTDSGTGLVHIAPAHGVEDFGIGVREGLPLDCPVGSYGQYEENVPKLPHTNVELKKLNIWKAQDLIIEEIRQTGKLLKTYELTHSYPISWRSKKPLIYRTTHQWFVSMDKVTLPETGKNLRESSLDRIFGRGVKGVNWVPGYGANRIGSMIENRPDWCISRQRAWGVPITIFVNKKTGLPVADQAVWEHIAGLVAKEGIDAWDNRLEGRIEELLPAGWLAANGLTVDDLEPVRDILDVWFDSGTTHAHVLRAEGGEGQRFYRKDGKRPADLYQEGSDQHRGWFHSSLLTSVANYGDAPYENVVTSGFVVDGQGRKFSKSLGNGVEPKDLLHKYGMDIIRLWVFSSDFSEDIRYSPEIMENMSGAYRKFRNVLRWILGNLGGAQVMQNGSAGDARMSEKGAVDALERSATDAPLPALEEYLMHRLYITLSNFEGFVNGYQFHRAYQTIYEFCERDLSGLYFEARKDALYCDALHTPRRKAAVAVLEVVFEALCTHLAPFMPFTADEAWRERFGDKARVHAATFTDLDSKWLLDESEADDWAKLLALRDEANKTIEGARADGKVGANASARVTVADLDVNAALLGEILGGAQVAKGSAFAARAAEGHKCPRCWQYYDHVNEDGLEARCAEALAEKA